MAKIPVNLWVWKNEQKTWQEFPWLSSDCQGALVSTASTNASICILRARFTQTQFTDDSAYDSLTCPLHDSTILTESRQNFHSSVLVISISALARTMASSSLGTTPGTKKTSDFGTKKTEAHMTWLQKISKNIDFVVLLRDFSFLLYIQLLPYSLAMATPIWCDFHNTYWQLPTSCKVPSICQIPQRIKNIQNKNRSWKSTCSQIGHKISEQWLFEQDPTLAHSCTFNLIKTQARP